MTRIVVALALGAVMAFAVIGCTVLPSEAERQDINKNYAVGDQLDIRTISSNCTIRQADTDEVNVSVSASFRPSGSFKFDVSVEDGRLVLSESFSASSTSGTGEWIITVPLGVEVFFKSSSGSLTVEGFTGSLHAESASGAITLDKGHGIFNINTASGKITASDTLMTARSSFTSASGNVLVSLRGTLNTELLMSSSSGNATIDYGSFPVTGVVEMSARIGVGKIESPFAASAEERFMSGGNQEYIRKTFRFGTETPHVMIKTASGKAVLKAK